jgi:poly(3-hydroxyalkanoate) synthetase
MGADCCSHGARIEGLSAECKRRLWLVTEGSWWTAWTKWLAGYSQAKIAPPPMGASSKGLRVLADAPGVYVHQR